MQSRPGIVPLDSQMLDTATTTLARAFQDDPMFEWIFPDAVPREKDLTSLNRVAVKYGLRYGRATQSDAGRCVAIWLPPNQSMSMGRMARSGMLATPFQVGFRPMAKFAGANGVMDKVHKRHVTQPHWQLLIVGVDPSLQGQGRGSAIVQEGLEQADRAALPCYLDTSKEANLQFYEKLGFTIVEEAVLGKGGPPAWGMLRHPTPPPTA